MSVFTKVPEEGMHKASHDNIRNWTYYQRLRREEPRKYYRSNIKRQMIEDRDRLGPDAFYIGGQSDG